MKNKNHIKNSDGHTMMTALAFMILLFALAASILMVASYRYQKVYVRIARNQLYLYGTELVDEYSKAINDGKFNEELAGTIYDLMDEKGSSLEQYAEKYTFNYTSKIKTNIPAPVSTELKNDLNGRKLEFTMRVAYSPQEVGNKLPEIFAPGQPAKDCVKVGDRMAIEYTITSKEENVGYRINADYYCQKNINVNTDGTMKTDPVTGLPVPLKYTDFKWELHQYKGKFYTTK